MDDEEQQGTVIVKASFIAVRIVKSEFSDPPWKAARLSRLPRETDLCSCWPSPGCVRRHPGLPYIPAGEKETSFSLKHRFLCYFRCV